jgi:hypothetical protein
MQSCKQLSVCPKNVLPPAFNPKDKGHTFLHNFGYLWQAYLAHKDHIWHLHQCVNINSQTTDSYYCINIFHYYKAVLTQNTHTHSNYTTCNDITHITPLLLYIHIKHVHFYIHNSINFFNFRIKTIYDKELKVAQFTYPYSWKLLLLFEAYLTCSQ